MLRVKAAFSRRQALTSGAADARLGDSSKNAAESSSERHDSCRKPGAPAILNGRAPTTLGVAGGRAERCPRELGLRLARIIHQPSYYLTKRSMQTRSASEVSALLRLACASGWCGLMNNPG